MGKKGKRSRRKAVTAAVQASIVAVQTKIEELNVKFEESWHINLSSQAADELREGIQLTQRQLLKHESSSTFRMNLPTWTWFVKSKLIAYSNLMAVEFDRRNFEGAIQIYENLFQKGNIKMKMEILSDVFPSLQLQYHEALLRQGKGNIDTFITLSKVRISYGGKDDNLEGDLFRSANFLRTTKHFDAAIVLGKQLEELNADIEPLATSYLEQYLVEYYPKFGRKIKSLPESFENIFIDMGDAFGNMVEKYNNGGFDTSVDPETLLVLAQWIYLLHQFSSDDKEIMMKKEAIGFIEDYLDLISKVETHCRTCTQTATESEVQLVCSGCRVACYCSIDHQRMTWKKEAVKGMRFGHEVLCPVMKAYRKWRHANHNGDHERVSRLRRRFERECLYLLSDGMGLKDKCFKK
ncbi:predicted protein [Chaetoceros tenuissimus]|uniref:MYND-type domain-containing protein n=1 Tax=Chaetoceros tenuissimus TaxID=426638 RepID=A0AAD3D1J1_9STRA|nr:predicted protein [Chaetoceros tenuissimus]